MGAPCAATPTGHQHRAAHGLARLVPRVAAVRTSIQIAVDMKVCYLWQAPGGTGCILLSKQLRKRLIEEAGHQLHAGVHGRKLPLSRKHPLRSRTSHQEGHEAASEIIGARLLPPSSYRRVSTPVLWQPCVRRFAILSDQARRRRITSCTRCRRTAEAHL